MVWSTDQKSAMMVEFWRSGFVHCPDCRARIRPNHPTPGGRIYYISVVCPRRCGSTVLMPADDPLYNTFRDLTDDEQYWATEQYLSSGEAACAVDGTRLVFQKSETNARTALMVFCLRCRQYFCREFHAGKPAEQA